MTPAVFRALALKAARLRPHTPVPGWWYQATRFAGAKPRRGEHRRQERERRAVAKQQLAQREDTARAQKELRPHLAGALASLSATDREAVRRRFHENASHQEVAAAVGTAAAGARLRVARAPEKQRRFFTKKGVALSVVALQPAVAGK